MEDLFKKGQDGKGLKGIPGAKPPAAGKDAAMLVTGYGNLFGMYSSGDTVGELGLIAMATNGEETKLDGRCGPYSLDGRGAGSKKVDHYKRETTIVVHRTDTGAEVARKVFQPNTSCPSAIDSKAGHAVSVVTAGPILKWLGGVEHPAAAKAEAAP